MQKAKATLPAEFLKRKGPGLGVNAIPFSSKLTKVLKKYPGKIYLYLETRFLKKKQSPLAQPL